ncbi:aromatic amino acid lyase [Streptomyces sediminimaris]|uniref:aromatic amino acid lyase n=1 Tax=Streptomyces sediminimaris TaxID=3383721 RepID=UPI00399AF6EA
MSVTAATRTDFTLPRALSPSELERVRGPLDIAFSDDVRDRVARCRAFLIDRLVSGDQIYGATTGFGPLIVFPGRRGGADQCDNVLSHLSAGQGRDLAPGLIRAAMLVRLSSLARGRSGASLDVMDSLGAALGTTFAPAVPELGSLGASGDLIPLAYVARALCGEGHAYLDGRRLPAAEALRIAGLRTLRLDGRDALALVNGTSLTTAAAAFALAHLHRAHSTALTLSAVLIDLLGSAPRFLSPALLSAFGHPDTERAGAALRERLAGTDSDPGRPLQEPYSVRCVPQLVGAVGTSLRHGHAVIQADLSSISDNPLLFPETGEIAHGGNFFGQPAAFAADLLTTAAVQLGNLAERQLDLLIDPNRNGGINPMLSPAPGQQHGVQGVQLAATAIVAQMRRASTPASMQSLPTNLHNQDVVPFGTQAALNALCQAELLRILHGSLAVALRQAWHVGRRQPRAAASEALLNRLAAEIEPIDPDRPLDGDVRRAADILDDLTDDFESITRSWVAP